MIRIDGRKLGGRDKRFRLSGRRRRWRRLLRATQIGGTRRRNGRSMALRARRRDGQRQRQDADTQSGRMYPGEQDVHVINISGFGP